MPKLVALHTVVYGKGETALPNTPFTVDEAAAAELLEAEAAREPTEAEAALWGEDAPKKRGRKAKGDADAPAAPEGEGDPDADLDGLT